MLTVKSEQEKTKFKNECRELIEKNKWDYFIHFSSNIPLTYYDCRPLMLKYFDEMRKFRSHFFWVAEPSGNKNGYDIFAVLSVPLMTSKITLMGYTYYQSTWQNITGKLKHKENMRRIMANEEGEEIVFSIEIQRLAPHANVTEILTKNVGSPGVEFDYFKY